MPIDHAAYLAKPDYVSSTKGLPLRSAPRHDDPLSRHSLSYLNAGGGSSKTTRANELFARGILLSLLQPTVWRKKCGLRASRPRLSQLLPLEWPDRVDARKDGVEVHFTCDHLGRGLHSAPPHWKTSSTGSRVEASKSSAVATRGSRPNCRRNAARLAQRACQLL